MTQAEQTIAVSDRGFQLGDGVFDTLIAPAGRPYAGAAHLDRLVRAAGAIGIAVTHAALETALRERLAEAPGRDLILRTTVTRGQAARGLWPDKAPSPTIIVTAQPWSPALIGQPARLITARVPRNEHSPLSRLKSLNYLDNILAARQAHDAGADDALILNCAGTVACTTIANVFAVSGKRLLTPPPASGCLDGIMRARVLNLAATAGLESRETILEPADLARADAVFLTNSVRLIRPVLSLDAAPLARSPVVAGLLDRLLAELAATAGQPDGFFTPSDAFAEYLA